MKITLAEIRGAIARGYCTRENEKKEMDSTLTLAMADEVYKLIPFSDRGFEVGVHEIVPFEDLSPEAQEAVKNNDKLIKGVIMDKITTAKRNEWLDLRRLWLNHPETGVYGFFLRMEDVISYGQSRYEEGLKSATNLDKNLVFDDWINEVCFEGWDENKTKGMMISTEDAEKLIQKAYDAGVQSIANLDNKIHDDLRESQNKLMETVDKLQWIDFAVEKPKVTGDYLVIYLNKIEKGFYNVPYQFFDIHKIDGNEIPTHWMPLPSLPSKQGEG